MGNEFSSALITAMQTKNTFTENGMASHSTSNSSCVDMFGKIASMRKESDKRVINIFVKAFNLDMSCVPCVILS